MVNFICLRLKQIVKATNEKAVFKGDHHFQFAQNSPTDPPSGKLVAEVEEVRGNTWAVAINGCPEVN